MRKLHRSMPITTGLVAGLDWGLLVALLDGLPLLLQGSPWPYLGSRLLALAYLAAIYGALGAMAGAVLGGIALAALQLAQRTVPRFVEKQPGSEPRPRGGAAGTGAASRAGAPRGALLAVYAALFAAVTATLFWWQRFAPRLGGWLVILILAAALGLGIGWLLNRAARVGAVSWPVFRGAVLSLFGVALVTVLAVAGFRAFLRDLPLFNPPTSDEVATVEQPNIVLITVGGLRPDHLGINSHDPDITPNIDALGWRGVRFEQAVAQAPWSEPSLASLLTSLYPSELGIACRAGLSCQPHLDDLRTTLAEALQAAGYHTRAYLASSWLAADLGFDQGFDRFESVRAREPFDLEPMRARMLGRLLGCGRGSAACRLLDEGHALLFDLPIQPGWGGTQVKERVNRFLDLHGDERFFLWAHYAEALPAYDLEPPFRPIAEGPLASSERRLKGIGYWELGDPFTPREGLLPDDAEGLKALYDGEVHRVDSMVGELLAQLEAHGLTDRTVVVVTADHGQEFMEHGGYTYGHSLYDEVLRVPLIVAEPGGAPPGRAVEAPVALLDLAPTLAEIAGASLPLEAGGRSLVPALRGETLAEGPIYSESLYRVPYELKALRQDGYKLIYNVGEDRFALYDLSTDPAEQQNVIDEAAQVAEAMKRTLLAWMARTAQVADDLPRAAPPAEFVPVEW